MTRVIIGVGNTPYAGAVGILLGINGKFTIGKSQSFVFKQS
jgi:hypothetical protein